MPRMFLLTPLEDSSFEEIYLDNTLVMNNA